MLARRVFAAGRFAAGGFAARGLAAAALLAAALLSPPAKAAIVERVVAVIEDRPILLSELRRRARPFLTQLPPTQTAERAAAVSQLLTTLLNRMVDEELEHRAAAKAHILVTAQEVEDALSRIATQNQVTVEQLIEEAQKSGLDARSYREEVRRQLLEAKLLNLKLQGRIRVTEDEIKQAYYKIFQEERAALGFRAAWIRIAVPIGAEAQTKARALARARDLVARARSGADFANLAKSHSDDAQTRDQGGDLGPLKGGTLPPAIDRVALSLAAGSVSEPISYRGDYYVLKVLSRDESQLPSFEDAQLELQNRVYLEKMERAKRHWLDGLRKQSHVDIRM